MRCRHLKMRFTHAHAEILGLLGARDDAAIVVREDDDGSAFQARGRRPVHRRRRSCCNRRVRTSVFGTLSWLVQYPGHHAPDSDIRLRTDRNGWVVGVFRGQNHACRCLSQSFHGEFTVDHRDHHRAVLTGNRAIDHEQITIMNSSSLHRSSTCSQKEGGCRVGDEFLVQVERAFDVVVGGGGKSGLDSGGTGGVCSYSGLRVPVSNDLSWEKDPNRTRTKRK